MADRYNRLDNTSPLQQHVENDKLNIPRSVFDLSHIHSGQALIGALTPVLCMETIPNQEFDINLNALVELRNPTTRKLLNGCRVFFHAYWSDCSDLWEGFNNYIDLGRSGNVHLTKPKLIFKGTYEDGDYEYKFNFNTPMSLMNMMGIPSTVIPKAILGKAIPPLRYFQCAIAGGDFTSTTIGRDPDFIDALPFVAYQKIWRDYYCNKNLLQNNKKWFPDNEDHFILSYECQNAFCIDYGDENDSYYSVSEGYSSIDKTPEANNPRTYRPQSDYIGAPILGSLKFRQFRGDRYTTALPFPDLVRGSVPDLPTGGDVSIIGDSSYGPDGAIDTFYSTSEHAPTIAPQQSGSNIMYLVLGSRTGTMDDDYGSVKLRVRSAITMNDIRALEVFTVFKERMARTSGDYNDMIEAQFGYNPHQHTREAKYIGGCYQDLVFSSISQTSASTQDSPLGSKAGQGVSSSSGRIGHFKAPNYGWLQIVMSIVPDVYYTQGLPKQFSRRVQEDNYFPVFNNLAPQAILNKELFISGDVTKDNDVFAFEERYSELKSRSNRVSGLSALSHDYAEFDASSVMARRFNSTPFFNSEFLTMVPENIDMDVFSFNDEPPFDFSVGFDISSVAPIPYTTVPGKMDLHA